MKKDTDLERQLSRLGLNLDQVNEESQLSISMENSLKFKSRSIIVDTRKSRADQFTQFVISEEQARSSGSCQKQDNRLEEN